MVKDIFILYARNLPDLSRTSRTVTIVVKSTMGATNAATDDDILFINGIGITTADHIFLFTTLEPGEKGAREREREFEREGERIENRSIEKGSPVTVSVDLYDMF